MSNFKLIAKAQINESICVKKYRDQDTGLTVVFADVESPLVKGYFAVTTETLDDDGLSHALEHMIFQGSEKYPYRGVLPLLATRCLSFGVYGRTTIHDTHYTFTGVGSEGFLALMPIYLDHILYPILTVSYKTLDHKNL